MVVIQTQTDLLVVQEVVLVVRVIMVDILVVLEIHQVHHPHKVMLVEVLMDIGVRIMLPHNFSLSINNKCVRNVINIHCSLKILVLIQVYFKIPAMTF